MSKTSDAEKAAIANLRTAFGLRRKRIDKGLKASWVADKMGISPSFLTLLEQGKRCWNAEQESKFLKAIGCQ